MSTSLKLITPPAAEPISLTDAKSFLKVDTTDDDTFITAIIKSARRHAESYTKRKLITQVWEYWLDEFPGGIGGGNTRWWDGVVERPLSYLAGWGREVVLPLPPFQTLNFLNTYDLSDNLSAFDTTKLIIDTPTEGLGRIALKFGQIWPVPIRLTNSVQINFTVGYGTDSSLIPEDIMEAMRIMIGHFYEKRQPTESGRALDLPLSVDDLLQPWRVLRLG